MNEAVNIRLELGINAQRFIQQVQIYNGEIEKQIEAGINLALDDVLKDNSFIEVVRKATKSEILNIVNKSAITWELERKIKDKISEKVSAKLEAYSEQIANKITASLK